QAATAAGLEAIVGARVTVGVSLPRGSSPAKPSGSSAKPSGSSGRELLLLVETPRGYRHLSRLLTLAHAKGGKHAAKRVGWDELEAHAGDLVALVRGDET